MSVTATIDLASMSIACGEKLSCLNSDEPRRIKSMKQRGELLGHSLEKLRQTMLAYASSCDHTRIYF